MITNADGSITFTADEADTLEELIGEWEEEAENRPHVTTTKAKDQLIVDFVTLRVT